MTTYIKKGVYTGLILNISEFRDYSLHDHINKLVICFAACNLAFDAFSAQFWRT